jgi:hypothetical protein
MAALRRARGVRWESKGYEEDSEEEEDEDED